MKIAITTLGTPDDIGPYLALSSGLETAGYQITLSTSAPQSVPAPAQPHSGLLLDLIDLAAMWAGYQAAHDTAPGSGRAA